MKRIISTMILCFMILFSVSNVITVKAESLEKQISDTSSTLEMEKTSSDELQAKKVPEKVANNFDRKDVKEKYILAHKVKNYSASSILNEASSSNTNPNNAYIVTNDTPTQGTIATAGEMRWYAFSLNEKSKITILLQMVKELDADIYMYALNKQTSKLELIGGSATSGLGTTEYYNAVLDAGTYFFAVGGYEGAGNFAFAFYQSTVDVGLEVNDSSDTATSVTFGTDVKGVIDNPYDYDFYKLTVTNATLLKYSISNTSDYVVQYEGKAGDSAAAYAVNGNMIRVFPGTYYFAVYSPSHKYSADTSYTMRFDHIFDLSNDKNASCISYSEKAGILFQADENGQNCYVNGNKIDFSYAYIKSLSNSAGSQNYDIQLVPQSDLHVNMYQSRFAQYPELQQVIPDVAYYQSSTLTNYSGPVLTLSLYSTNNPCYMIHNACSGAYSGNSLWQDLRYVNVFVDPNTGKVIDIEWFNYFYEKGSNTITYYRPYSMKHYYPYYDEKEPKGGDKS